MATVSVIIPTWNRADTLEKAVRSVLRQTFPPLEVLVCDDGSTDSSRERVRLIGDDRVRWLEGIRGGRPAIPRNRGIGESRGDWVAFLDDDDEWLPDKLEKQILLAEKLGSRAICSNANRSVSGHSIGKYLAWERDCITFDELLQVNLVICSSVLVHKSLFTRANGFPEDPRLMALEDYALWLRIATLGSFAYVAEPLVVYHDNPQQSIRAKGQGKWEQRRTVFSDLLCWLERDKSTKFINRTRFHYYKAVIKCLFYNSLPFISNFKN